MIHVMIHVYPDKHYKSSIKLWQFIYVKKKYNNLMDRFEDETNIDRNVKKDNKKIIKMKARIFLHLCTFIIIIMKIIFHTTRSL